MAKPCVALVNMPFASVHRPSLALGLLQPLARAAGFRADLHLFNLRLAQRLGLGPYEYLAGGQLADGDGVAIEHLSGEWLFSRCFHGRAAPPAADYLAALRQRLSPHSRLPGLLRRVRRQIAPFLADCLAATDWSRYTLVGFSTTFEQTFASLCLARALKHRHPQLRIAFGGANCEAGMGLALARHYPFVDYVCRGEADRAWPELLEALARGEDGSGIRGFTARRAGVLIDNGTPPPTEALDALPTPDYDDYFQTLTALDLTRANPRRAVLLESSRGCWWGARSHCTFCGLNGAGMAFRRKSPQRALEEASQLVERHGSELLQYTDNILDPRYFASYLPALAEARLGAGLFYETKSNLRREQLRTLAEAGVEAIQPGIESFDDEVLRLMGKGVTGLHNLAVLKWARLYGVQVLWNFLYGFPREPRAAYRSQAALFRRCGHLDPPQAVSAIRLDRFSPYQRRPEAYGLEAVRPGWAYAFVYALPEAELMELAYFFDYRHADGREPRRYSRALIGAALAWQRPADPGPRLLQALPTPAGGLEIWDTRHPSARRRHRLTAAEARLYAALDTPRRAERVSLLGLAAGLAPAESERCLRRWDRAGLIARRHGSVLGLALIDDPTLAALALPDPGAAALQDPPSPTENRAWHPVPASRPSSLA
ncbi:MAG TPA: RiPP maturation radical SAM C-methyltransferase [Nevskiaceae bacterium]|nr:RiPP maturation radical SAM C-methyltransferase [Nevskiaceae bacterium]